MVGVAAGTEAENSRPKIHHEAERVNWKQAKNLLSNPAASHTFPTAKPLHACHPLEINS